MELKKKQMNSEFSNVIEYSKIPHLKQQYMVNGKILKALPWYWENMGVLIKTISINNYIEIPNE